MDDPSGFTVKDEPPPGSAAGEKQEKVPQREKIIEAVADAGVQFWCDPDGHAFATVPCEDPEPDGPIMHLRVRGRRFALICRRLYGEANPVNGPYGSRPGSVSDSAMSEAVPAFEAMALATNAVSSCVNLVSAWLISLILPHPRLGRTASFCRSTPELAF